MTTLRPPPLTLLDKYHGQDTLPLYSTTVTVTGGGTGHGRASGIARSDDGQLAVDLRLPKELGGPGGGTNPEQLFRSPVLPFTSRSISAATRSMACSS
jgi:hypothetical protein